jgi:hypothetical protein
MVAGQIDEIREWFRNYKSDGKYEGGKWVGITEGQVSFSVSFGGFGLGFRVWAEGLLEVTSTLVSRALN